MCKVRFGFVSNSSSSSYIIHKSEFPSEEVFQEVINELRKLEITLNNDETLGEWGDSGRTFDYNQNYLMVETYYVYGHIHDAFLKAGVDFEKIPKYNMD